MRLLIVTQVVDRNDPILGFFHTWVEEFSKQCERVEIICLKEGSHSFPAHVRVHSLGKEKKKEAVYIYAIRFFRLAWKLRNDYDAVFVHMNVEYLMLAGILWRQLKKRVVLWYVHGKVSLRLRVATFFADEVLTASPESFRLKTSKVRVVGHGIDLSFFYPDPQSVRGMHLLSVGRLMPVKRHDLLIRTAASLRRPLRIAGDGPARVALQNLAIETGAVVEFLGGVTQERLRDEYRRAAVLLHASETGSLDKVVLEALACDCPVVSTSNAYENLPVQKSQATPEALAQAVLASAQSKERVLHVRQFALPNLVTRILESLRTP